jgi:hypothetical protein
MVGRERRLDSPEPFRRGARPMKCRTRQVGFRRPRELHWDVTYAKLKP